MAEPAVPAPAPPSGRTSLLRERRFAAVWGGSAIAAMSQSITTITIFWLVFAETHSAYDVAAVGVAQFVPLVGYGMFSGVLADRFNRLRLMTLANIVQAVAIGVLSLSIVLAGFHLLVVLGTIVTISVGQSTFRPARNSALPSLVTEDALGSANGLVMSSEQAASILGTPLAGLLIGIAGATATLLVNGVGYVLAALMILVIGISAIPRAGPEISRSGPDTSFFSQLKEGFVYLRTQPAIVKLTVESCGANFFLNLIDPFLVVYAVSILHGDALVFAAVSVALALGFAVGALMVSALRSERHWGISYGAWCGLGSLSLLALVLYPSTLVVTVALFLTGFGFGLGNATFITGVQKSVPSSLLGRYFSLDEVGSLAASPAGVVVGGILIGTFGIHLDYLVGALGAAGSNLGVLAFSDVRKLAVIPTPPEAIVSGSVTRGG